MLYFFIQTRVSPSVSVTLSASSEAYFTNTEPTAFVICVTTSSFIHVLTPQTVQVLINYERKISLTARNRSVATSAEVNQMRKRVKSWRSCLHDEVS